MSRTKLSLEDAMTMSTEDIVASFEALDKMRSLAEERAGDLATEKIRIIRVVQSAHRSVLSIAMTDGERSIAGEMLSRIIHGIEVPE